MIRVAIKLRYVVSRGRVTGWRLWWCLLLALSHQAIAVTLPVRLLSISVQCRGAQVIGGSETLDLGVGSPPFDVAQPNGDLAPTAIPILGTPVKLGTLYVLQTPSRSYYDDFFLSTPDFTDANNDGIDDFFQPEIAIEGSTSQGYIEDGVNGAELPIHATWHRDAGASSGSFRIPLPNSTFPRAGPFDVPFEIQNFSGVFIATVSGTTASGTLFLRQTDHPNNTLLGDFQVNVSGHDQLQIVPGSWLHSKGVAAKYLQISALQRAGTKYIGEIVFDQGMPPSPEAQQHADAPPRSPRAHRHQPGSAR